MCQPSSFQSVDPAMLLQTHVPDDSGRSCHHCVSPRHSFRCPLPSEHVQLSPFFRVRSGGFRPLHQIFIEWDTGAAGSPRDLLASTQLTFIPSSLKEKKHHWKWSKGVEAWGNQSILTVFLVRLKHLYYISMSFYGTWRFLNLLWMM